MEIDNDRAGFENTELHNPMFSFLLPTRKRPIACIQSICSIFNNASCKQCFEILLAFDEDDTASLQQIKTFCESNSVQFQYIISERYGYNNLHEYVNKLCSISKGTYLWLWNDDASMLTTNWDVLFCEFLAEHKNEVSEWSVFDFSYNDYNFIFPCIQKAWYNTLGHFSLNCHCDTWIECIAKTLNLIQKIDTISIFHLKDRVPQEHLMDISYDEIMYSPHTFYSPEITKKRELDTFIINTKLQASDSQLDNTLHCSDQDLNIEKDQ